MPLAPPPALDIVVQQHAEEAALLRHSRSTLVRAPHVGLLMLGRHDERIEAHLDGLHVAGERGKALLQQALQDDAGTGSIFATAVLALRQGDEAWLTELLRLPPTDHHRGLRSALGWVTADTLQGVVRKMLAAPAAAQRALAIDACRMHRVDPGPVLTAALTDPDAALRATALRAAGALARSDLLGAVRAAIADSEPTVIFEAACAACRLGERQASLKVLQAAAPHAQANAPAGPEAAFAGPALALLMAASPAGATQELARDFSARAQAQPTLAEQRRLVQALALLGDTRHVPWLLERMKPGPLARLAGEAFSWITGIDLAAAGLEQLTPGADVDADAPGGGPTEEADDEALALDPDQDLPWPDTERVQRYWQQHPQTGQRQFMGHAQDDVNALWRVLQQGNQRQRRHAALLLALALPQHHLLPVAAPAWRQRRWLKAGV